jgi:hypothetical protein
MALHRCSSLSVGGVRLSSHRRASPVTKCLNDRSTPSTHHLHQSIHAHRARAVLAWFDDAHRGTSAMRHGGAGAQVTVGPGPLAPPTPRCRRRAPIAQTQTRGSSLPRCSLPQQQQVATGVSCCLGVGMHMHAHAHAAVMPSAATAAHHLQPPVARRWARCCRHHRPAAWVPPHAGQSTAQCNRAACWWQGQGSPPAAGQRRLRPGPAGLCPPVFPSGHTRCGRATAGGRLRSGGHVRGVGLGGGRRSAVGQGREMRRWNAGGAGASSRLLLEGQQRQHGPRGPELLVGWLRWWRGARAGKLAAA